VSTPRVMHVVPAPFDPEDGVVGGAERYALELARHMADVRPTSLVSFGRRERTTTIGRLRCRVIGDAHFVRGQRTNPIAAGLLGELRRADIVHCHQQHVVASSAAALYGRLARKPVFVTDLGGGGWDISGYVSTDAWYRGHLHISEYSRSIAGQSHVANAHVIMGGVDSERFSPSTEIARDGSVLFVGRLAPHKGLDLLIEAMPADIPLVVIGRPYDSAYMAHLHAIASGKQVTWQHDCDDDALVAAYRRAACVVLPSVYESAWSPRTLVPELLGQTLLEGMACGTAVICTDVASMPEIVVDGGCGLVVPPNDTSALRSAVQRLVGDGDAADAMGRAGRARVLDCFTWSRVVERCLAAYAA
jgi:glycosyltransferase involved in cell wall biosynthesis